jgi:heptosyltransferase-2
MRILIELPTWLGDTVMVTPAIENVIKHCSDPEITLIGSPSAIDIIKSHPRVKKSYIIKNTYIEIYRTTKALGMFDLFFSFRGSLRSTYMKFCINAIHKYQFKKKMYVSGHQVEKYNQFINESLNIQSPPGKLSLHNTTEKKLGKNKILGINPGASYGEAKQWHSEGFSNVASALSHKYDIVIFGGPLDENIAQEIEINLIEKGVKNYQNLASKTSILELISQISNLDLLITGDSGPMHIAGAFQVPTVTIFGPTRDNETSQWLNKKSINIKKNLECQPCMQRVCPLGHHDCMNLIKTEDVLNAVDSLKLNAINKSLIN